MSGAGVPDFFYREAQRLGYLARSSFKVYYILKYVEFAEQKVKVPTMYCDSRVQTVSADGMSLPRSQIRALSPQNKGFSVILSDMCPPVSGISTRDAAISVELGMQALDLAVGGTVSAHLRGDDDIQMEVGTEASSSNSDATGSSSSKPDDEGILKKGGNLVVKLLESQDVQELGLLSKPLFKKASWFRPKATRPSSREIYLICQGFGDKCK